MEIIKKPPVLLSNHEVWNILKEVKESKRLKDQKNLATVTYEAIKYLEETNCVFQTEDSIRNFLQTIKEKHLRLTKPEKLQIINNRPNTLVELQLLIEENEERFSEEALNLILKLIREHLPGDPSKVEEEKEEEEDAGNDDGDEDESTEEEENDDVPMEES